jgi:hypothetical protein
MLRYMGRENLEDYNAVFLIQLESWEAAVKSGFVEGTSSGKDQAIAIATLLGWLEFHKGRKSGTLNDTARAWVATWFGWKRL